MAVQRNRSIRSAVETRQRRRCRRILGSLRYGSERQIGVFRTGFGLSELAAMVLRVCRCDSAYSADCRKTSGHDPDSVVEICRSCGRRRRIDHPAGSSVHDHIPKRMGISLGHHGTCPGSHCLFSDTVHLDAGVPTPTPQLE